MTDDVRRCTGCGRALKLDAHHIPGAAYDPATTDVCVGRGECHHFLTRRQLDNGVDLSRDTPKSEVDIARASAHGTHDLIFLSVWRRHSDLLAAAEVFDRCLAVGSALLDLSDDADRPSRFLPDTIGARHRPALRCAPVDLPEDAVFPVLQQLIGAVASQGEIQLMDDDELSALRYLEVDAEALYEKLERLLGADESVQAAWADVPELAEAFAQRFFEFLIALYEAVTTNDVSNLPSLIAMAEGLAPVFQVFSTLFSDAVAASTTEECRALLLRPPELLRASR
jgi:hypothetical protein